MKLTDYFIKRPVSSLVIVTTIVALGLLSLIKLPLRQFPVVNLPVIAIKT